MVTLVQGVCGSGNWKKMHGTEGRVDLLYSRALQAQHSLVQWPGFYTVMGQSWLTAKVLTEEDTVTSGRAAPAQQSVLRNQRAAGQFPGWPAREPDGRFPLHCTASGLLTGLFAHSDWRLCLGPLVEGFILATKSSVLR